MKQVPKKALHCFTGEMWFTWNLNNWSCFPCNNFFFMGRHHGLPFLLHNFPLDLSFEIFHFISLRFSYFSLEM